jgi:hypothetical protein
MYVQLAEGREILLEVRLYPNHDMIGVHWRVELRDVRLPIRIGQCLLDQRHIHAESRGGVAIDIDHQCGTTRLLVACHILQ